MKKITILPKGPYKVEGHLPLAPITIVADEKGASVAWEVGDDLCEEAPAVYSLCRCGLSADKPFCDGAHVQGGFTGEEVAAHGTDGSERTKYYVGSAVDLLDEEKLCASFRFCDAPPRIWDAALDSAKPGYTEIAKTQARNCLAGRLTIIDKDGTPVEEDYSAKIGVVNDPQRGHGGPLVVVSSVPLIGADGREYRRRNRMALCRCGETKNMPFCDGGHLHCQAMALEPEASDE